MDPRSRISPVLLDSNILISQVREWLARGHSYMWAMEPSELISDLQRHSDNGEISFYRAFQVIENAKTSKMRGDANRGLDYFKHEWKKLATSNLRLENNPV